MRNFGDKIIIILLIGAVIAAGVALIVMASIASCVEYVGGRYDALFKTNYKQRLGLYFDNKFSILWDKREDY